jgi:hypothetical protein
MPGLLKVGLEGNSSKGLNFCSAPENGRLGSMVISQLHKRKRVDMPKAAVGKRVAGKKKLIYLLHPQRYSDGNSKALHIFLFPLRWCRNTSIMP